MIDYSKIKKKLGGREDDGQDVLRLRTATVGAVNVDGTVDLVLSGVTVEDVSKIGSAVVDVGQEVQVMSYRGSLLVLGGTGVSSGVTGEQPIVRDAAQSNSSASAAEIIVATLASRTYKAGRAYKVWVGGGVIYSANSAFSSWNVRKGTTTGGTSVLFFPRHSNGAATTTLEQHLNLQGILIVGGTDVTTQLCLGMAASGGTAQHAGSAANARHMTVLPAGYASAWTNASVLS